MTEFDFQIQNAASEGMIAHMPDLEQKTAVASAERILFDARAARPSLPTLNVSLSPEADKQRLAEVRSALSSFGMDRAADDGAPIHQLIGE